MLYYYVCIFREFYGELYALFKDPGAVARLGSRREPVPRGVTSVPLEGRKCSFVLKRLALEDEDSHQTTGARGAARDVADGACVARERVALHTLHTGSGG